MRLSGLSVFLLTALTAPADAAIINLDLVVEASNFPANAPVGTVSGRFTLTFDNSASIAPTTAGLTVAHFNLPALQPKFLYLKGSDFVVIGTDVQGGGYGRTADQDDFGFYILLASTSPTVNFFGYSSSTKPGFYNSASVVAMPPIASVPEPASWAMLIAGFGLTGTMMRQRRVRDQVGSRVSAAA